jgi:sec-independent protein translocase protein TatB
MFDVGFSELVVIALVALIVIGPERLPRVARTVGALLGRAQRYVNDVKADIQREVNLEELKSIQSTFQEAARSVEQSVTQAGEELQAAGESLNKSISSIADDTAVASAAEPVPALSEPPAAEAQVASTQLDLGLESRPAAELAAAPKA